MNPPVVGDLISNKYRIVRLIGDGGMGVVYEARHERLGSHVALKFLQPELAKRPGLAERFLQEARVSAAIQSPHVTRVTDVDTTEDGSPFLVMELLSGESLQSLLDRRGKLPPAQAIDFAIQIAAGLEAAHAIGVVHRDLKPDNVFVTPAAGGPLLKLIDFGIAKLRASTEFGKGLTRQGVIMGTPEYMAPEQLFAASEVDHRADVYSLGVMLFEMLAGVRPADGNDVDAIVAAVSAGHVRKLADLEPGLPLALVRIVERAMRPNREERQASAGELRLLLVPFASELSHAGKLAAAAALLAPGRAPPAEALAELPPPLGVPKTEPPDDARPPPGMSQLFAARTSLAQAVPAAQAAYGAPPRAGYGAPPAPHTAAAHYGPPPPTYGAPPGAYPSPAPPLGYGASQQAHAHAPAPTRRAQRRRGPLLIAGLVIVVGGGAAVGYAAFVRLSAPPVIPPLPDATFAPAAEGAPIETIAPLETAAPESNVTPTRTPVIAARPATNGAATVNGGAPTTAATATDTPTFQLPFPLPSNLAIPTTLPTALPTAFPSTLSLPSGFPTAFPSSFPGFPGQTPRGPAAPTGGTDK